MTALATNTTPPYNTDDNPTNCCPRFTPEPWDGRELHFDNKLFVKAATVSLFHVPLNMGSVFARTWDAIRAVHAEDGGFIVLSHEDSAWHAEHLFAVSHPVPLAEMVRLSGDFLTKVFEGPYADARRWAGEMQQYVEAQGRTLEQLYFFYTTCPRCAKHYGKNYVVGVAQVK